MVYAYSHFNLFNNILCLVQIILCSFYSLPVHLPHTVHCFLHIVFSPLLTHCQSCVRSTQIGDFIFQLCLSSFQIHNYSKLEALFSHEDDEHTLCGRLKLSFFQRRVKCLSKYMLQIFQICQFGIQKQIFQNESPG